MRKLGMIFTGLALAAAVCFAGCGTHSSSSDETNAPVVTEATKATDDSYSSAFEEKCNELCNTLKDATPNGDVSYFTNEYGLMLVITVFGDYDLIVESISDAAGQEKFDKVTKMLRKLSVDFKAELDAGGFPDESAILSLLSRDGETLYMCSDGNKVFDFRDEL